METKVVHLNNVIDNYTYSEKKLIKHKRFRVVYNDEAEKRIFWRYSLYCRRITYLWIIKCI